ncbi:hypothetical protein F2Q70_00040162 [Brassica cretica]|uniref:Uncharacterized protein n=1 Tax=Brassica cretica TaxID=69181 RepID=A0A8S9KBG3_BRACR|nr:hypothetical protein F2Q70_00040162 [Brassica cretica]
MEGTASWDVIEWSKVDVNRLKPNDILFSVFVGGSASFLVKFFFKPGLLAGI